MEKIENQEYSISYDAKTATISCKGIIRLSDKEYPPLTKWLFRFVELEPTQMILNLRELKALNSSGITMLGKLVFAIEKKKTIQMILQANQQVIWQKKLGVNFQRLMPNLQIEWE